MAPGGWPVPDSAAATGRALGPPAWRDPFANGLLPRVTLAERLLRPGSGRRQQLPCPSIALQRSLPEFVDHFRPGDGWQGRVTMGVHGLVLERLFDARPPGIHAAGVAELEIPLACGSLRRWLLSRCDEQRTKPGTQQRRFAGIAIGRSGSRIDCGRLVGSFAEQV